MPWSGIQTPGKTTLFNRLCGVRAKTANYPGVTVDSRVGRCGGVGAGCEIIDLPGIYSLSLDVPEANFCREILAGEVANAAKPDAILVVMDASNLVRNSVLAVEALTKLAPTIIALNMMDLAEQQAVELDVEQIANLFGCVVVPVCARTGDGLTDLQRAMADPKACHAALPATDIQAITQWAAENFEPGQSTAQDEARRRRSHWTDVLDRLLMHPALGAITFVALMAGLFWSVFSLATVPMDWIDGGFTALGVWVTTVMSEGPLRDLLVDGVIAGVGGTVIFLPQICLLFFLLTLLEDTGYLARAAFVTDRWLRPFGLPGQAFVPLLTSHACALPGIMCTRLIPDRQERLATILVAPFMSCSARLPVYVLLTTMLFRDQPALAALAFVGCYLLGVVAALLTAWITRKTLLRGATQPLVLELPSYKRPSLRNAVLNTLDQSGLFLRKAGTVILAISMILWWLSAYPGLDQKPLAVAEAETAASQQPEGSQLRAELELEAARSLASAELANSFAGRIGRTTEPVFAPLGYDWQITIPLLSSFAAREVFVSILAVVFRADDEEEAETIAERIRSRTRADGSQLFTPATSASLLVFYVLALQCLPTLAVTRRESGGWRWALLQLTYMSGLAYVAAFFTRLIMNASWNPMSFPFDDWQFWVASVIVGIALLWAARPLLPRRKKLSSGCTGCGIAKLAAKQDQRTRSTTAGSASRS